ncbi:MAG: hypothetical protein M3042_02595 [Actinomycetota bacterium]|nr:hypothetical protein [Actinomycetota bacterium]
MSSGSPRRRRPRLISVLGFAVAVVLCTGAYVLGQRWAPWQDGSTHGRWHAVFDGQGATLATRYDGKPAVLLAPKRTTRAAETHAALVVTTGRYSDFVARVRVRTISQLRAPAANPWEVGWVLWGYTAPGRFYALTLKPNGWELSKQDPSYPGGQRFLASGHSPGFTVGAWHTIGITQTANNIVASADGHVLVRFSDRERPYLHGSLGLYTEDARAEFVLHDVSALPVPPTGLRS